MIQEFYQKLKSGRADVLFFARVNIGSILMSLISGVYTWYETKDPIGLVFATICCTVLVVILLYAIKTERYDRGQFLTIIADTCLLLPFGFLWFGGSNSGMPACFILVGTTAALCTVSKYRRIAFGVLVAVTAVLFILEGVHPEWIVPLDANTRRTDIIFSVLFGSVIMYSVVSKLTADYTVLFSGRMKLLEGKTGLYQQLFEDEAEKNRIIRELRQEAKQHNRRVLELLESGRTDEAAACLREYDSRLSVEPGKMFCLNTALNRVLNYTERICRNNGITFSVFADVPEQLPIAADVLSSVAANILEHAVNGALESGTEEKMILFKAVTRGDQLVLSCTSSCQAEVKTEAGMLPAYSAEMESILAAAKKDDWSLEYEKPEEHRITCSLVLNLEYEQLKD